MFDQVEVRPIRAAQAEAPPAQPDDEIGLVGALLAEALQARRIGVVAVADPHLACDRRTALDRLGAMSVGQVQVREAAATQIIHCMHPPVGPFAATLADAGPPRVKPEGRLWPRA